MLCFWFGLGDLGFDEFVPAAYVDVWLNVAFGVLYFVFVEDFFKIQGFIVACSVDDGSAFDA